MSILRSVRILAALAALAVVALAPSLAVAHAGHHHAPLVASAPAHVDAGHAGSGSVHKAAPQELVSAPAMPSSNPDAWDCSDRGCCGNSGCSACSSAVAPNETLTYPPAANTPIRAHDEASRAPPVIEGPQRPPKRFA